MDIKHLADFEAIVSKVQTMQDGPRVWLDLQECGTDLFSILGGLKYGDRYLHVIIYDEAEYQRALKDIAKGIKKTA